MKKILSSSVIISLIISLHFMACADDQPDLTNTDDNHLKYFGFALTDYHDNLRKEVDGFVNLVDISIEDFSNIDSKVAENVVGNNDVIIHLQGLFTDIIPDSNSLSGFRYELLPSYISNFELWFSNNNKLTAEQIAAFTIADEPAWNSMKMSDLHAIAALVKKNYPFIPIMVIEGPGTTDQLVLTDDIDWIGFDRYGTLSPHSDPLYLSLLENIKGARTNIDQKLVIIMESQWLEYYSQEGFSQDVLIPMADSYYRLAKDEKDVIALISYLLPSGFDTPSQKGFLDLKAPVREKIIEIGRDIIQ